MASWDVALTVVYPIPDRISNGYLIRDRIYYGRLFIGSKNKLVQRYESASEVSKQTTEKPKSLNLPSENGARVHMDRARCRYGEYTKQKFHS